MSRPSYNSATDPYTRNQTVSLRPPLWVPWAKQTWPSMKVGQYNLSKPMPPLNPNTGMPVVGLNQIKHACDQFHKGKTAGRSNGEDNRLLAALELSKISGIFNNSGSGGLLGKVFSRFADFLNPSSALGSSIIDMSRRFLNALGGPLSLLPQWSNLLGLLGSLVNLQLSSFVRMFLSEVQQDGNGSLEITARMLQIASNMLKSFLGTIADQSLVEDQKLVNNVLGAGMSATGMLAKRFLSATESEQFEGTVCKIVKSFFTNLYEEDVIVENASDGGVKFSEEQQLLEQLLLQYDSQKTDNQKFQGSSNDDQHNKETILPSYTFDSSPTAVRDLGELVASYADVLLRPGMQIGGSIVGFGRVGGWTIATDMRGIYPRAVTNYGIYYPVVPYANPLRALKEVDEVPGQKSDAVNFLESSGANEQDAILSRPTLSYERIQQSFGSCNGLPGILMHLEFARQQWRQEGTVYGNMFSRLLQLIEKLLNGNSEGNSTCVGNGTASALKSLTNVLADSPELIQKPEWQALQNSLRGLADVWGEWLLTAIEPGQFGVGGMQSLLAEFLDAVGIETGMVVTNADWSKFLRNTNSILKQILFSMLKMLQGSLESYEGIAMLVQDMQMRETPKFVWEMLMNRQQDGVVKEKNASVEEIIILRQLRGSSTRR